MDGLVEDPHLSPAMRREKQTARTQEVPLLTPSQEHLSPCVKVAENILGEIKVVSPKLAQRTDQEKYCQAQPKSRKLLRKNKEKQAEIIKTTRRRLRRRPLGFVVFVFLIAFLVI